MGRRRKRASRHGSLAYLPRGRASHPTGKINYWPEVKADSPKLLAFAGYKVGMSFVYLTSTVRGSPTFGQEIQSSVTFMEAPPLLVCGFRAYVNTPSGLKTSSETWMSKTPKDMERLLTPSKKTEDASLEKIGAELDKVAAFRAILCTQPRRASVHQKKPELFEVEVAGGDVKNQFEYLKGLLGKEVSISDVFKEGQMVDTIGVTKAKGWQGAVKRWGVKTVQHKSNKTVRGVGTLGPWTPHYVMYTIPRPGQMGFHQRTESNRRILKLGKEAKAFMPKGGFPHYGAIKDAYIVLKGSVQGPTKRLVKLRYAAHPPSTVPKAPNILYMGVQPSKA